LHYPKGASGVTIGPGYDMKGRSASEVVQDLTNIGVDPDIAQQMSGGAGLTKPADIDNFVKNNKPLLTLTAAQQMQLLQLKAPDYEKSVKERITIDIFQFEYDALVSFAYNEGSVFAGLANLINAGRIQEAMQRMKNVYNKSGGNVLQALVDRRRAEINLYLYGNYGAA